MKKGKQKKQPNEHVHKPTSQEKQTQSRWDENIQVRWDYLFKTLCFAMNVSYVRIMYENKHLSAEEAMEKVATLVDGWNAGA